MTLLIAYVLMALSVSFLCSLLEASLLTITPSAINSAKQKGLGWAVRMEAYKRDIDRPLSAILTLNTVAHTMGAAGAGAQYARVFGNTGEAIFAGALTLAILLLTEIIPKTLGARFAVPLAGTVACVLPVMIVLLAPLVWMSKQVTGLIGRQKTGDLSAHREEFLAMARVGAESGHLERSESQFIQNLIQLHALKASDIMTPRPVVFALPESTPLQEAIVLMENQPFNRIPVHSGNLEEITGFVLRAEALCAHFKDPGNASTLAAVKRPIGGVPDFTPVDGLFRRFVTERHQLMVVTDEFGITKGLVSLEDVIETIFGIEIMDEKDQIADLRLHARQLWAKRARKAGIPVSKTEEAEKRDHSA